MRDWFAPLRKGSGQSSAAATSVNTNTAPAPVESLVGVPAQPQEIRESLTDRNTETPGTPDQGRWLHEYEERAAIRQYDGGVPRQEAERLAYEEVLLAWHRSNGQPPEGVCPACDMPLDGWRVPLPDGATTHSGCVTLYGQRWRERAAEALWLAGVCPPAKSERSHAWSVGYCDGLRGYAVDEWFTGTDATGNDYRDGWKTGDQERRDGKRKHGVQRVRCS